MQQGNRHCTANIRNTRAHSSRRWRIRKRRNRTLQVVGRFLTLFVLTLVLAVGIMLSGAALLGWWPSKEIPRQENSASTPLLTPAQTPEPLTVDVSGINSPYALLMCRDGTELGQESADASIYPASMTKIMTVLLGVENIPDLDAEVTLDPDIFNDLWAENASMAGFAPGETVTVRDILYGSLLPSGAECSVTIAQLVDSGVEAFANRMNNRAAEIGMQHTHFTNPTGLHDPEHVSTVRDIAMLLNTALENPTFREIFTTRSYTTTSTDAHPGGIQLYSRMFSMLGDRVIPGVTLLGGKTGFTDLAGQCLASLAECGGEEYILVTAGAPSNNDEDLLHIEDAITVYTMTPVSIAFRWAMLCTKSELRFRQYSFNHRTRNLRSVEVLRLTPYPLYQHAIVPFEFPRQVGWLFPLFTFNNVPLRGRYTFALSSARS